MAAKTKANLSFEEMLPALKMGDRARRKTWQPTKFIQFKTSEHFGKVIDWGYTDHPLRSGAYRTTDEDLFACDWELLA